MSKEEIEKILDQNESIITYKADKDFRGLTGSERTLLENNDKKMLNREKIRLELSIEDGIKKYGKDKEIIVFMHYPPITLSCLSQKINMDFIETMEKYKINKCYYGHLHGTSHKDAVEGNIHGIDLKLISADYLDFNLLKI